MAERRLLFPSAGQFARLVMSFIWDWAVPVLFVVAMALADTLADPAERVFSIADPNISFPHKDQETFPNWLLYILAVALPVVVTVVTALLRRSLVELHSALLGLAFSITFTGLITEAVKQFMGGLRPDFLARCSPDWTLVSQQIAASIAKASEVSVAGLPPGVDMYFNGTICTGNAVKIVEGRKSFPSGHSSVSFAGLGYLALYLSAALGIYSRPLRRPTPLLAVTVSFAPVVLALFIALSRIIDYRHSGYDVFFGAALGVLVSWWSFRHYFAPLMSVGEPAFRDRVDLLLGNLRGGSEEEARKLADNGTHELNDSGAMV